MSERIILNLDAESANTEAGASFEPLPKGWYTVEIDEVDDSRTVGSGDWKGEISRNYKFKVIDGDYSGRIIFANAIISAKRGGKNQSSPLDWSHGQKAIQKALGSTWEKGQEQFEVFSADEMVGKELKVKVGIRSYANKEGEEVETNDVKSYLSVDGTSPSASKKSGGFEL